MKALDKKQNNVVEAVVSSQHLFFTDTLLIFIQTDAKDLPDSLKHLDKALVDKIESDIISNGQPITFSDITGLDFAKKCVEELICWSNDEATFYLFKAHTMTSL